MSEGDAPRPRRGLFLRIVASFVGGVLLFMLAAAGLAYWTTRGGGAAWVAEVVNVVDSHNDELAAALAEPTGEPHEMHATLEALARPLEAELDAWVRIVPGRGVRQLHRRGIPLPPGLDLDRSQRRALRRGAPVVQERRLGPPRVVVAISAQDRDRVARADRHVAGFVVVERRRSATVAVVGGVSLLLASLFAFAWPLARSLTGRLRTLEASTRAFADGDLEARAQIAPRNDEIDQLALSFNEMAGRIASLITGQRTLLANVSHELRTPLARMQVQLELLEERAAKSPHTEETTARRLREGLEGLRADVTEMNRLVEDLLTSGRLDLGRAIEPRPFDLQELASRVAAKFGAHGPSPQPAPLEGDPLLVERVLSNLLANARRACPDGTVSMDLEADANGWRLGVEDEGRGVPRERREEIFEAFTRLDGARTRDAGGVGLGLYLSRQVAQAHGGRLRCIDRRDGARGARFELWLPRGARSPDGSATKPAS